jgi:hypothetical protein
LKYYYIMSQFNLIGFSSSGANVFNNLTITENGAMVVPYGVSSERPLAPVAGMLRYDTTFSAIEYYTSQWNSIPPPLPLITDISNLSVPDNSNGTIDVSVNIFGSNFGTSPSVYFIGSDSIERQSPAVSTIISGSQVRATIPTSVYDNSNQEPFAVKLTNTSYGFSTTTSAPLVIDIDSAPFFITTSPLPDISNGDISGSVILNGELDISAGDAEGSPLTWSSPAPSPISDIQSGALTLNSSTGVVTGNLANPGTNTTYNFNVKITDAIGNFRIKLYSFTFTVPVVVDFLVIAGGGGGGSDNGNGGGAGGYRTSWGGSGGTEKSGGNTTVLSALVLNVSTSYSIQVGGGGAASGTGSGQSGSNGKESYIKLGSTDLVKCTGGGGGASFSGTGNTGGSGGAKSGSGIANQGTAGGTGGGGGYGGGGALRTGGASNSHGQAKGGGDGLTSTITGSSVTRGGGGGGGCDSNSPSGGASGGAGGGGHGTDFDGTHHDSDDRGLNRYGGGGGGGADQVHGSSISNGAAGGSGTIILRYPSAFTISVTGGVSYTNSTVGSDTVTEIYANASGRGGTTSQTGTISFV